MDRINQPAYPNVGRSLQKEWQNESIKRLQFQISEAFSHEVQRIRRSGIFECEFIINGKSDLTNRLSEQKKIILFRMVQEGLQNIIKHAKATRVLLMMESKENEVVVQLTDNGEGFDAGIAENLGLGIENIKKRARMAGGEAVIFSRIGEGTSIAIQIPYE